MLRAIVILAALIAYGILLVVVVIGVKKSSKGSMLLASALCVFTTACILLYGLMLNKGVGALSDLRVSSGQTTVQPEQQLYEVSETTYTPVPAAVTTDNTAISNELTLSFPAARISSITFPSDYLVTTPSEAYNADPLGFDSAQISDIRNNYADENAEFSAFTQDLNLMFDLVYYTDGEEDFDFLDCSDEEIAENANSILAENNDDTFSFTTYSVEEHNHTGYLVFDGEYLNDRGEQRNCKLYICNKNGYLYYISAISREPQYLTDNLSKINKILDSIMFYPKASAQADNSQVVSASSTSDGGEYHIGDTWTVPGQWNFTITSVEETSDRNEFSDKKPQAVYNITYRWENIGYVDESGLFDGLAFDVSGGTIVDSMGQMGYSYPGGADSYGGEVPVGAYSEEIDVIGVEHAGDFTLTIYKYDGNEERQSATYKIKVN